MSEERSNGGQAFPAMEVIEYGSGPRVEHHIGMTLRDYFASKAMQGFVAAFAAEWSHGEIARAAYAQADSMLAERAK